jgi:predicted RNase H-like HicB family nuclease
MSPFSNNRMKLMVKLLYDAACDGYVAEVPQLPGCTSQGKTVEAALENARAAVRQYLRAAQTVEVSSAPEMITSQIEVSL